MSSAAKSPVAGERAGAPTSARSNTVAGGSRKASLGYWLMGLRFKGTSYRLGRALLFSASRHQTFLDAWRGRD